MQKQEFLDQVAGIMERPAGSLTGGEQLEDLEEWDSVAMMGFIAFADEHFSKILAVREFVGCDTVNDLGKLVGVE